MKCSYCGFTYDDELVCPICGTPAAPSEQTASFAPQPAPTVQAPVSASSPCVEPDIEENKKPAAAKSGKGLKIAALCVLSVIAAALVANVAIQAFSLSAELKHYRKSADVMDREKELYDNSFKLVESEPDYDFDDSDSDGSGLSEKSDNTVHKVGESYDFGSGVITLKSVRVSQKTANFDSTKQQVAFFVEVTNNTNSSQIYEIPSLTLGEKLDAEAFAFAEFNNSGEDVAYSFDPGESCSAVFYYNLPTENQTLNVTVSTESQNYTCFVETKYTLETKDIK